MTALLTLDLATSTGWAAWRPGDSRVASGVVRMPKTGEDVGWFLDVFDARLRDLLTLHSPEMVVFEAPWIGPNTHQDTARKLLCLAGMTELVCRRAGLRYREANNASVRKHFIGKGRGDRRTLKDMTMRACQQRGWDPENDDEADALALLDYAAHVCRIPVPWSCGGLFAEKGEAA